MELSPGTDEATQETEAVGSTEEPSPCPLPLNDCTVIEKAMLGLAAEQARQLAVLRLDLEITRRPAPNLEEARQHLQRIAYDAETLEEKAQAAAMAYVQVAVSGSCFCGECQLCSTTHMELPIRNALVFYCLALSGHRSQKLCIAVLRGVVGTHWSQAIEEQFLNAYRLLLAGIPGAFRSHNKCIRGQPSRMCPGPVASARSDADSPALPDGPAGLGATDAPSMLEGHQELPPPPLPPPTSPESARDPFSSFLRYLTCGFVPEDLACEDALKVQINALLLQLAPDSPCGPVLCASCAAVCSGPPCSSNTCARWGCCCGVACCSTTTRPPGAARTGTCWRPRISLPKWPCKTGTEGLRARPS